MVPAAGRGRRDQESIFKFGAALVGVLGVAVILLGEAEAVVAGFVTAMCLLALGVGFALGRRPVDRALVLVAGVFAFAYFGRYVAIRLDPETMYFLLPSIAWPALDSPDVLRMAMAYTCASFLAAASTAVFLRFTWLGRPVLRRYAPRSVLDSHRPNLLPLAAIVGAILLLDAVMLANGIGVQGQFVEQPLPFKLTGAVVYLKTVVLPCFALVYVYWAEKQGRRGLARFAVAVMLVSGAADMALFSSRGALLQLLLFVALLWWVCRFEIRRSDAITVGVVVATALVAVPAITAFRLFGSDLAALGSGFDLVSWSQIALGLTFVFFRITGIDQFMVILDMAEPIPSGLLAEILASPRGIAGFYTTDVLLFPDDIPQTFAPSALGWLYLTGGVPGLLLGGVALAVLVVGGWRLIEALLPRVAPVAKAYFLLQLIVLCTEGIVGSVLKAMLIALAAYWFLDQALRLLGGDRGASRRSASAAGAMRGAGIG